MDNYDMYDETSELSSNSKKWEKKIISFTKKMSYQDLMNGGASARKISPTGEFFNKEVTLRSCEVISYYNPFHSHILVDVNCGDTKDFQKNVTNESKEHIFIMDPNSQVHNYNRKFLDHNEESITSNTKYMGTNLSNPEVGIFKAEDEWIIPANHSVMKLIQEHNQSELENGNEDAIVPIHEVPGAKMNKFVVEAGVAQQFLNHLKEKIIPNLPVANLKNFEITIDSIDGKSHDYSTKNRFETDFNDSVDHKPVLSKNKQLELRAPRPIRIDLKIEYRENSN